jgi:exopolysaccharide biosynthesis polyprenyl glycosylphosphotransferase
MLNKNTRKPVFLRLRPSERRLMLLVGDLLAAGLALLMSVYFWGQNDYLDFSLAFISDRLPDWFIILPIIWLVLNIGLYDIRRAAQRRSTILGIATSATLGLILYLIVFFVYSKSPLPRRGVAVFIFSAAVFMLLWRLLYIFTAPQFMRRVLIIGAGRAGGTLANIIHSTWPQPFFLVGYIDDDPVKKNMNIEGFPVLGSSEQLFQIVEEQHISDLVFAISGEVKADTLKTLLQVQENGVLISTMPIVYEQLLKRVPISLLQSEWIIRSFVDELSVSSLYEAGKRIVDFLGALVGSILTLIFMPLIAAAILIDSGRPVFFMQERMGKNGKPYHIIKYRTMRPDAEKDGTPRITVENDERITRVGKFLRKSHLDELPQFFNVLKGEMSLVGPLAERQGLVENLQKKVPFYRARLLVKPGITGWAQVNFGYAATVEDTAVKLEYDLFYIKHRNLWLDIKILILTVMDVVGFKGR